MKKIPLYFSALAALALASCGTSVEIAKRHFNSGYYVSIHTKQQAPAEKADPSPLPAAASSNNSIPADKAIASAPAEKPSVSAQQAIQEEPVYASVSSKPAILPRKHPVLETQTLTENRPASIQQAPSPRKLKRLETKLENLRGGRPSEIVMILLCIFLPFIAVGIVDNWGTKFLIDLILCLLFYLPGIIYAFIVCFG